MGSIKYYIFTRFLIIVIIQTLLVSVFGWFYLENKFSQNILKNHLSQLVRTSANIKYFYSHQVQEISRLTKQEAFLDYNKSRAQNLVERYIQTRQLITSVHYYKSNGDLDFTAKLDHVPNYEPEKNAREHISDTFKEHFEKVLKEKKSYFSQPIYTRAGVFYHVGSIPVFNKKEEIHGILSFAFFPDITPFNQFLSGLVSHPYNFLLIADPKGNIVASQNVETEGLKAKLVDIIQKCEKSSQAECFSKKNALKFKFNEFFLVPYKVKELPFYLVKGVNKKILKEQKENILGVIFIVVAISLIMGFLVTFIIAKRVSFGLSSVSKAVKALRSGTPIEPVSKKVSGDFKQTVDEIEELAVEVRKGKLLGRIWGISNLTREDHEE